MLTREELQGQWTELKGKIRKQWGQITDDELQMVHGDAEQLVGLLQKRTGQTRQQLEQFLDQSAQDAEHLWNTAATTVREATDHAAKAVREQYAAAEEYVGRGYQQAQDQAQQMIRTRPLESLAATFGAGLVTGIVLGMMLRGSRR